MGCDSGWAPPGLERPGDLRAENARLRSAKFPVAALEKVTKDTNPKDAVGVRKAPMSTVPVPVIMEIGLAMLEGARKYGRHNYRVAGVRASVYYDALWRHMGAWWEGENIDLASGLNHVTKALATLTVLRDAMINHKLEDDRPPAVSVDFVAVLNKGAGEIISRLPDPKPAFTEEGGPPGPVPSCDTAVATPPTPPSPGQSDQ